MSYIKNNLNPSEKLKFHSRVSKKFVIFNYLLLAVGAFAVFYYLDGLSEAITAFVLVLIGYLPFALITYFGTECGVTNKRVVSKKGIISRNVSEMNLTSIESVNIDQGVLGRVLKVGTLKISGRGTTAVVFSNIDDPISIRKLIQNKN